MAFGSYSYSNPIYGLGIRPTGGPSPVVSVTIAVEEGAYTEAEYDQVLQDLVDFFTASTEYEITVASKRSDAKQNVTSTP